MLGNRHKSVTAEVGGILMSVEYSEQTGRLCVRHDGSVIHEWFPPHSWVAIASVAGARNWGTQPSDEELRALLENTSSKRLPLIRRSL
jgi:hypothetical protein